MKRPVKLLLAGIGIVGVILCLVVSFSLVRYQSLLNEEPDELVLTPSREGITYCTMDGEPLQLDLYFPASPGPWQVLVYVHGGSFTSGDKQKGSGIIDIPAMTEIGYAVAAVNYRLMPGSPFPAALQDVKCAIRFLRANAAEYNLKTERIGIWGGSAGGYYAAMAGLTGGNPEFEIGEYLEQSSRVDAVVDMFGPADLTAPMGWLQRLLMERAFGTSSANDPVLVKASPVNVIPVDAPPFFILHGEQDSAVPLEQSQDLFDRLSEAGIEVELVVVENANHNFKPTGGRITPNRVEISTLLGDFFNTHLR